MRHKSRSVLPGFGLSLGITCTYLSLMVLLPLATVFTRTAELSGSAFWATVTDPRVVASYRVTFGASFVAALVNTVFGLLVACRHSCRSRRQSGTAKDPRWAGWVTLGTMNGTRHRRNPEPATDGGGR